MKKHNFYHTIGTPDIDGKIIFERAYRIQMFWYNLRQFIAFLVCPELSRQRFAERYNLDYIVKDRRDDALKHAKDVRGRDKAIFRLQKEVRRLNRVVKEKDEKLNSIDWLNIMSSQANTSDPSN